MKAYAIKPPKGSNTSKMFKFLPWYITFYSSQTRSEFISEYMNNEITWKQAYRLGWRCVPVEIREASEVEYTLQDIIDAVQYGFDYREQSQHNGKNVPDGNVLQWLMGKKNLIELPEDFKNFKICGR